MNKKDIHNEMVRIQGRISGNWYIYNQNNKMIDFYTTSGQSYNVVQYQLENKGIIQENKEYALEYRKLKFQLNAKPEVIKKPVIEDGFYELQVKNGLRGVKMVFNLYSELTEKQEDKYLEQSFDQRKNTGNVAISSVY